MKRYKQSEIDELANILKNDGVISVPTDTVYGLCARINSKNAYDKLVNLKKRPVNKSFPVVCKDYEQIKSIAIVDEKIEKLIQAFMPGPITLILNKKLEAFSAINNRGEITTQEMGVRMAPTKALYELIQNVGSPLFMTSANLSSQPICKDLDEIERLFPNLDGMMEGDLSVGMASTIVDCTKETVTIQRPGPILKKEIIRVLKD